jgi:hypothetical protein
LIGVGRRLLSLVALVSAVAGCQIILWSWPAGEPVPNIVGVWEGTWMIAPPLPIRVIITDQNGTRVSGLVTYGQPSGPAMSTGITGQFGVRNACRVLLLEAAGLDRTDELELTTLEADHLEGAGTGRGLGGQQGPVVLRRR